MRTLTGKSVGALSNRFFEIVVFFPKPSPSYEKDTIDQGQWNCPKDHSFPDRSVIQVKPKYYILGCALSH